MAYNFQERFNREPATGLQESLAKEMARTDFLDGLDGKKPCRNLTTLANKYDLPRLSLVAWTQEWMVELKTRAQMSGQIYGKALTPETVAAFEDDVTFLRKQIDKLRTDLETYGTGIPGKEVGTETYCFKMDQLLKLQKKWTHLVGVDNAIEISQQSQKDMAKRMVAAHQLEEEKDAPEAARRTIPLEIFDMPPEEGPSTEG